MRKGAAERGIEFLLTKEEVAKLLATRKCKCCERQVVTGRRDTPENWCDNMHTIDRIDADGPYTRDNVQVLCASCNLGKDLYCDRLKRAFANLASGKMSAPRLTAKNAKNPKQVTSEKGLEAARVIGFIDLEALKRRSGSQTNALSVQQKEEQMPTPDFPKPSSEIFKKVAIAVAVVGVAALLALLATVLVPAVRSITTLL